MPTLVVRISRIDIRDRTFREFILIVRIRALSSLLCDVLFLPEDFAALTLSALSVRHVLWRAWSTLFMFTPLRTTSCLLMVVAFAAWPGTAIRLLGHHLFLDSNAPRVFPVLIGRWWATSLRYIVISMLLYPLMLITFACLTMLIAIFI
jgi:hypothetical protein